MKQAIVACGIIYRKVNYQIEILLTKRSASSSFLPGAYEFPGGHIEPGENLTDGLIRELKEELNLSIIVENIFSAFTYSHNGTHTVELLYFAKPASDIAKIQVQADEVESYRWIKEEEIETIVTQNKKPDDQELVILRDAFAQLKSDLA